MTEEELKLKQEQFRKETEIAKFEAFSLMCQKVAELEEENTKLKCECSRCVYTDSPCVLSDYEKDENGTCSHFKDVFDENAELKEKLSNAETSNEWYKRSTYGSLFEQIINLKKEKVELKEQNLKDCEAFNKTMKETNEQWKKEHYQLTKAKELLEKVMKNTWSIDDFVVDEIKKFINNEVEK